MQTYSCLIVDDEPPAREILKRYVEKMPMLELAGECSNAFEVISFLHNRSIDVIFLDIQMPQLSGLELLGTLAKPPKVIFTTAFGEYAVQSYEVDAVDYLLKPIKFERFVKAVNKAIPQMGKSYPESAISVQKKSIAGGEGFLYFRSERKMVKVVLSDVFYVESLKDYVKIVTGEEQVVTKHSMSALEAMLPGEMFLRVHRSFIVSLDKIRSFSLTHIQLISGEIPIGKLYQREVMKVLNC
jgi:DNA-binding LytR/AlgR family response regulator